MLRDSGSTLGAVVVGKDAKGAAWEDPNLRNLVAEVSVTSPKDYDPASDDDTGGVKILAVDCGMKYNIVRFFIHHLKVKLKVVPWDYDFSEEEFDGLFLSNGPGNPQHCNKTVQHVRTVMQKSPRTPIFGICLGNQIL